MPRLRLAMPLALTLGSLVPTTQLAAQFEDRSVAFFLASDVDGDELLTLPEFRTFIRLMADAGAPMSDRIRRFGVYRVAFGRVDTNGDGVATPDELRAAERAN